MFFFLVVEEDQTNRLTWAKQTSNPVPQITQKNNAFSFKQPNITAPFPNNQQSGKKGCNR